MGKLKNPTYVLYRQLLQKLQLVKVWENSRYVRDKLVECDAPFLSSSTSLDVIETIDST